MSDIIQNAREKEKTRHGERIEKILTQRTEKLAQKTLEVSTQHPLLHLLSFSLGTQERYALSINRISKIIKLNQWTKVPKSSDLIKGVISLDDTLYCLVELTRILGLESKESKPNGYAIFIKETQNCLEVEDPGRMHTLHADKIIPWKGDENPIARYTKGIAASDLIVLDTDKILAHPVWNNRKH